MTETQYTNYGHSHGANGPQPLFPGAPCGSAMAQSLPVLNVTALTETGEDPVVTASRDNTSQHCQFD